jgi:hypothetical protein
VIKVRISQFAWMASAVAVVFGVGACGGGAGVGGSGGSTSHAAASSSSSSGSGSGSGSGGGSSSGSSSGSGCGVDAGSTDKAAGCTGTFGQALTNSFGRLDGTVLAVLQPKDAKCPMPNSDHVILEVTMMGAVYRMVVNVQSTGADPDVRFLSLPHALPPPAWSEGWHTGLTLDYVADLGVHVGDFKPYGLTELSAVIADAITIGQKVSVFATSSGGALASSAHLIHRQDGKADGAVVLDLDCASPRALLFHFADQMF